MAKKIVLSLAITLIIAGNAQGAAQSFEGWSEQEISDWKYKLNVELWRAVEREGRTEESFQEPETVQELERARELERIKERARVRDLVRKGANVNMTNFTHGTPLHRAVYLGRTEMARELLECGALVDAKTIYEGYTPLFRAVQRGSFPLVHLLIGAGADVNARAHELQTVLHVAAYHLDLAMVEFFLSKGVNAATVDKKGRRPIDCVGVVRVDYEGNLARRERIIALLTAADGGCQSLQDDQKE
ncbi:ankyrin repeat domain-containing protein [Candidatus Babeliales bacterium]|nr:ankyrin repeat domain-containing protein [Candidatus Babeliales bacterium]